VGLRSQQHVRQQCDSDSMLRNFLYLDTTALDAYLSAVEDGLRVAVERERSAGTDKGLEGQVI